MYLIPARRSLHRGRAPRRRPGPTVGPGGGRVRRAVRHHRPPEEVPRPAETLGDTNRTVLEAPGGSTHGCLAGPCEASPLTTMLLPSHAAVAAACRSRGHNSAPETPGSRHHSQGGSERCSGGRGRRVLPLRSRFGSLQVAWRRRAPAVVGVSRLAPPLRRPSGARQPGVESLLT